MTFRQHFDSRLGQIEDEIIRMGGIASEMVRLSVDAVITGDLNLSAKIVAMDNEVDRMEEATLRNSVIFVMQEAPVANDLRKVVSILGCVGEIEKVADDAVKLARRATKLTGHFPAEMKLALNELGELVNATFLAAVRLLAEFEDEAALKVIKADKAVDQRYTEARLKVFQLIRENPQEAEHLVRVIDAFHALEHVADHAVEIASRLRLHNGSS